MTTWVLVFVGIALAGLAMLACFGVWLWRKATALMSEAGTLLQRADQLVTRLDQIQLPGDGGARRRSVDDGYEIGLSDRSAT